MTLGRAEREQWERESGQAPPYANGNGAHVVPPLEVWDAGEEPGPIPPRQWLLGNQFCRGFLSSIVAGGGVGKTALRLLQFISLATGRPLAGQHVFKRSRVLIISLEDDAAEMQRRIKAVLDFYGIPRSELLGWMGVSCPKMSKLAFLHGRNRIVGPLEAQLCHAIEQFEPDLVSLDPFVKTHSMSENDNGDMDFVCDLLVSIAIDYNIAVDSPHHVHKGTMTPGDADAGRGASGIKDAARLVYTLVAMTEEEAQAFGINAADRHAYIRLDPAKVNIARHSSVATWFQLHSQDIGNGAGDYPNGDSMQVAKPWEPPATWSGTSAVSLNAVLDNIAAGLGDGQRYSNAPAAGDRAAWAVVQKHHPTKTEAQCRSIIHAWLDSGLIYPDDYRDPVQRKTRKGLFVNDAKRPS